MSVFEGGRDLDIDRLFAAGGMQSVATTAKPRWLNNIEIVGELLVGVVLAALVIAVLITMEVGL
jgi:hypothetical protein